MCIVEIAMATSEAISLVNSIQSVKADKEAALYSANMSIQQAKIAERNAAYSRQEGIEDAREERLRAIQNMGKVKTDIASGNIMLLSSTALNLTEDEYQEGELNALQIMKSSEHQAQSYLDSAQRYYSNASLQTYKAKNAYKQKRSNFFADNIKTNAKNFYNSESWF